MCFSRHKKRDRIFLLESFADLFQLANLNRKACKTLHDELLQERRGFVIGFASRECVQEVRGYGPLRVWQCSASLRSFQNVENSKRKQIRGYCFIVIQERFLGMFLLSQSLVVKRDLVGQHMNMSLGQMQHTVRQARHCHSKRLEYLL